MFLAGSLPAFPFKAALFLNVVLNRLAKQGSDEAVRDGTLFSFAVFKVLWFVFVLWEYIWFESLVPF